MDPDREPFLSKRRESRAGARKVTSLSSEQLERKRANDREAQRTIRQRTKEHIEHLEQQVAELKLKGDQFDDVVRRNAALEGELGRLRQQLGMTVGRQSYGEHEQAYSGPTGPGPTFPTQFTGTLATPPVSRGPPVISPSAQIPIAHDWQSYNPTRPSSIGESSNAEYPGRVEPYILESQFPAPQMAQAAGSMPVTPQQAGFSTQGNRYLPNPPGQSFPQPYQPGNPQPRHDEMLSWDTQQVLSYAQGPRSMSVPAVPSERAPAGYTVVPSSQQPPPTMNEQQGGQPYNYPWVSQP